jgi:sulfur-oxidizing protein SoxX
MRYDVQGDAIPTPFTDTPGDAARGREVVAARLASCLYCHAVPGPERFMGTIGPGLAGVGGRYTPGQLRLRVADPTRVNPAAVMPAYFRVDGLDGVAQNLRGRPILSAQELEDVVAYLSTLK